MNLIDLGCKSFLFRLLFSLFVSLALIALLREIFPEAPFWLALAIGFMFDVAHAILRTSYGDPKKYVAHIRIFLFPAVFGISLAYFFWGIGHEYNFSQSLTAGATIACLVLIERAYIWKETLIVSGLEFTQ